MGFEPTTSTLARWSSTTELRSLQTLHKVYGFRLCVQVEFPYGISSAGRTRGDTEFSGDGDADRGPMGSDVRTSPALQNKP